MKRRKFIKTMSFLFAGAVITQEYTIDRTLPKVDHNEGRLSALTDNGLNLLIGEDVYELSVPWDVSTAVYLGKVVDWPEIRELSSSIG